MTDTPARLLRLLSLLQTPREWPGSELAERLGVSPRTIRRDVDRLRELGYPVEATMGSAGGYRLVAGRAMPPLLLDNEEAVAIAVGLRSAAGHAVAGVDEASVRALTKLEQVLPTVLRHRVRTLHAATSAAAFNGPTVDPGHLTTVAAAIATTEKVRFGYVAADGSTSSRLVEPRGLVPSGRRWYLVAFDVDRDAWRSFRLDRMSRPRPTGARSAERELPAADASAFVAGERTDWGPTYRVDITFQAAVHDVAGRVGDAPGELREAGAYHCRLVADRSDDIGWLAGRLAMLSCEFRVDGPEALREQLRALGARVTRAASGGEG